MSDQPKLYIAGIGMITPVGFDTASTAAAVKAGVSAYHASSFFTRNTRQPITMAQVPTEIFTELEFEIDEGSHYGRQSDRIIKMAILAIREAVSNVRFTGPVPLILALPEELPDTTYIDTNLFITNLLNQKELPLKSGQIHLLKNGRAAGLQGIDQARQYLFEHDAEFVLLGGSDSYAVNPRVGALDRAGRVLAPEIFDGFAPGEGAGFLLLTRHSEYAMNKNGWSVIVGTPGLSQEIGHLFSDKPYTGDGLDRALKISLEALSGEKIRAVYSSLNGEHFWAKEYGVAYLRNKQYFHEEVKLEHPMDCFGDLGSATGPVLLGLAAEDLLSRMSLGTNLVYSSSDGPWRAAVTLSNNRIS